MVVSPALLDKPAMAQRRLIVTLVPFFPAAAYDLARPRAIFSLNGWPDAPTTKYMHPDGKRLTKANCLK